MAKSKDLSNVTGQDVNEQLNNALVLGKEPTVSFEEMFAIAEQADGKKMQSLSAEYLKLETDETYHFIFQGMDKATLDGQEKEVVKLIDKAGRNFISAAAVLVTSCKKVQTLPCMVRVVTRKEIKAEKGKYLDMSVFTFPASN
jgi:hypothetical protein